MTKVKEKMMQWSRYLEIILKKLKKRDFVFIIICVLSLIALMIFRYKRPLFFSVSLITAAISITGITIIDIYRSIVESFEYRSIEFVQKNNFWNIMLSNIRFVNDLFFMIGLVIVIILLKYCTFIWAIILYAIISFVLSAIFAPMITYFFENRLKE